MGVRYDVLFSDGKPKLSCSGGCFGGLNEAYWSTWMLENGGSVEERNVLRAGTPSNQDTIRYKVNETPKYFEECQELLNSIPWMKPYVVINPSGKFIDVKVAGRPADQGATTLFLFRNISDTDNYKEVYFSCRDRGYNPLFSAIFSCLIRSGGTDIYGEGRYWRKTIGEYDWVNPSTFGREALRALITADENYNPWFLDDWDTLKGYRRDMWFREQGEVFKGLVGTKEGSRVLVDCFSVEDDDLIFERDEEGIDEEGGGFYRDYENINLTDFLTEFENLWNEIGVNPR